MTRGGKLPLWLLAAKPATRCSPIRDAGFPAPHWTQQPPSLLGECEAKTQLKARIPKQEKPLGLILLRYQWLLSPSCANGAIRSMLFVPPPPPHNPFQLPQMPTGYASKANGGFHARPLWTLILRQVSLRPHQLLGNMSCSGTSLRYKKRILRAGRLTALGWTPAHSSSITVR